MYGAGNRGFMKYRRDIDGLRALAVLPVLFFHAHLPGFSGGYVGVDVFFVISGYLITSILAREVDERAFSLVRFYERRIRRIFPALFVMIAVCFLAATMLMMPRDLSDFAKSAIAATLSASNMLFWWQSGYFDGAAAAKPLLHTWSLAVEEQFYILFPPLLWAIARWRRDWLNGVLIALALLSFASAIFCSYYFPTTGFYWAPMRAWELMIGGLIATGAVPLLQSRRAADVLSVLGPVMIGIAVVFYTDQTPFPGITALLPTLGAGLSIYANMTERAVGGRVLAAAPLVGVGLISYSLYLWHWPALVFFEYYTIDKLTQAQALAALLMAFVLAYLSWRFIEQPFRSKTLLARPATLFGGAAAIVSVAVAASAALIMLHGLPQRLAPGVQHTLLAENSHGSGMIECSGRIDRELSAAAPCFMGNRARPSGMLWGDSHGDALTGAVRQVAADLRAGFYYAVDASCPPLLGIGTDRKCIAMNDRKFSFLQSHPEITHVIVAARWSVYTKGRVVDFGPAESNEQLPSLMTRDGRWLPRFSPEAEQAFAAAITRTIAALKTTGKQIVIVYPIPETGYNIPTTLARIIAKGGDPASFTRPVAYYDQRHRAVISVLDTLPYGGNLHRVQPRGLLCPAGKCLVYADGMPLYYDDDHLSLEGARRLAPAIEQAFSMGVAER